MKTISLSNHRAARAMYPPGVSIAWIRWAALLLVGCGGDSVCARAADKMEQCKIGEAIAAQGYARLPLGVSRDECSGVNECTAKFVAAASCAELDFLIVQGLTATDPNKPPVLSAVRSSLVSCPASTDSGSELLRAALAGERIQHNLGAACGKRARSRAD